MQTVEIRTKTGTIKLRWSKWKIFKMQIQRKERKKKKRVKEHKQTLSSLRVSIWRSMLSMGHLLNDPTEKHTIPHFDTFRCLIIFIGIYWSILWFIPRISPIVSDKNHNRNKKQAKQIQKKSIIIGSPLSVIGQIHPHLHKYREYWITKMIKQFFYIKNFFWTKRCFR